MRLPRLRRARLEGGCMSAESPRCDNCGDPASLKAPLGSVEERTGKINYCRTCYDFDFEEEEP